MWEVYNVPILITEEGTPVPPLSLSGFPLSTVVCYDGRRCFTCITHGKGGWVSKVILIGWAFGKFCPRAHQYIWLDINVAVRPRWCAIHQNGRVKLGDLFICPITGETVKPKSLSIVREFGYNILASRDAVY